MLHLNYNLMLTLLPYILCLRFYFSKKIRNIFPSSFYPQQSLKTGSIGLIRRLDVYEKSVLNPHTFHEVKTEVSGKGETGVDCD